VTIVLCVGRSYCKPGIAVDVVVIAAEEFSEGTSDCDLANAGPIARAAVVAKQISAIAWNLAA
jgi:hypothetical protein